MLPTNSDRNCLSILTIPEENRRCWLGVLLMMWSEAMWRGIIISLFTATSELSKYFDITETQFLFSCSLYVSTNSLFCQFSCSLINFYGYRLIIMIGSGTACLCMYSCYFTNNKHIFIFIFCLAGGTGSSMIYASFQTLPAYWFSRHRGWASLLTAMGGSFGIMSIPYMTMRVIANFGSKYTFLLFGGCYTMALFLGAILFEPQYPIQIIQVQSERVKRIKFYDQELASSIAGDVTKLPETLSSKLFGVHHNASYPTVQDIVGMEKMSITCTEKQVPIIQRMSLLKSLARERSGNDQLQEEELNFTIINAKPHFLNSKYYGSRPMYRSDILYRGNLNMLKLFKMQDTEFDYYLAASRAVTSKDYNEEGRKFICSPEAITRVLSTMYNFKLMFSTPFLLLYICQFIFSFMIYIPYIFIRGRAKSLGACDDNCSWFVILLGCGHLLSRWISMINLTLQSSRHPYFSYIYLMSLGAAFLSATNLTNVFTYHALNAVFMGFIYGLVPLLFYGFVLDLCGIDYYTNAYGVLWTAEALGVASGPGLSGLLLDKTGSYQLVFYFISCCMVLTILTVVPIKILKNLERENIVTEV